MREYTNDKILSAFITSRFIRLINLKQLHP